MLTHLAIQILVFALFLFNAHSVSPFFIQFIEIFESNIVFFIFKDFKFIIILIKVKIKYDFFPTFKNNN